MGNFFKGCLGCFGLVFILALVIGGCSVLFGGGDDTDDTATEDVVVEETKQTEESAPADRSADKVDESKPANEPGSWEAKTKEVAASDKSETEKFDEVSLYAQDYVPSEVELADFEVEIINEYTSGKYLSDPTNDEYMLENIFKSEVIDVHYSNGPQSSMGDFAFDFWQNTKYVYRGVDPPESQPVQANEEQMDKALPKIQ